MKKIELYDLKPRNTIYSFILKNPGVHQREIIRKLDFSEGTIRYHLNDFIKKNLIEKRIEDGYSRFYASNKIGVKQKKILHMLRKNVARNIILYLFLEIGATQKQLSEALDKDPKTIEFHLKKMLDMDIIECARVGDGGIFTNKSFKRVKFLKKDIFGREIYFVLKDIYLIYDTLIIYKKGSFDDRFIKDIVYVYGFLFVDNKFNKKNDSSRWHTTKDRIEEKIYDVFPHPYHV
ncbi:MAG: winged helix-turn-helix transcriptional regulator [Thermoplasmatales archaeon]|nr:MAG: winged helix-turn-helix transcriptional regulator [Thermoplasmatales archaeon]